MPGKRLPRLEKAPERRLRLETTLIRRPRRRARRPRASRESSIPARREAAWRRVKALEPVFCSVRGEGEIEGEGDGVSDGEGDEAGLGVGDKEAEGEGDGEGDAVSEGDAVGGMAVLDRRRGKRNRRRGGWGRRGGRGRCRGRLRCGPAAIGHRDIQISALADRPLRRGHSHFY